MLHAEIDTLMGRIKSHVCLLVKSDIYSLLKIQIISKCNRQSLYLQLGKSDLRNKNKYFSSNSLDSFYP